MSRRQNKQLQDRVSTTSKPGTRQKSVRSKGTASQRPGSQLSGTNPEKSVKSGKQSLPATSHHLERKNSTEARSLLPENESGNGVHHQ